MVCNECWSRLERAGGPTEWEATFLTGFCGGGAPEPGGDPPGAASPGAGQEDLYPEPGFRAFSILFDNDFFYNPSNDDRNYTMGLTFQGSGRWVRNLQLDAPLRWVDRVLSLDDGHGPVLGRATVHDFRFGHTGFTPNDLTVSDPIPGDRPYASMLYVTVRRSTGPTRIFATGRTEEKYRTALKTELTVGVLGLGIAENVQTRLHRWIRRNGGKSPDPKGWPHQISDGGEPTFKYKAVKQTLVSEGKHCFLHHDISTSLEGNLGYYTSAGAGAVIRVGRLVSPFWSFDSSPNDSYAQNLPRDQPEGYLFASVRATGWIYNAFLQGQFRDSPVTFRASEIERLVADFSAGGTVDGIPLGFAKMAITYAIAGRTPEFEGEFARTHIWAGGYLTFRGKGANP
jgi:hypothetical protein